MRLSSSSSPFPSVVRTIIIVVFVLTSSTDEFVLFALGQQEQHQNNTFVFINEIHYDNAGSDTNEAIEVVGPIGTNFTQYSLVLYDGNSGTAYNTVPLLADNDDTLMTKTKCFVFVTAYITGIQNGSPDGVALIRQTTGDDTQDAIVVVVQFLSYEGTFTAQDGFARGVTSTDIGVSESSSNTQVGQSLQLVGNGQYYEDFTWSIQPMNHTFGSINNGQTFAVSPEEDCSPVEVECVSIQNIQGEDKTSPFVNQRVKVCNNVYVTAIVHNGFYIQQDPNGLSNDSSSSSGKSSGLFVLTGGSSPNNNNNNIVLSDPINIEGTVTEFFGLTELTSVTYTKVDNVDPLFIPPVELILPIENYNEFERYESMLVSIQTHTNNNNNNDVSTSATTSPSSSSSSTTTSSSSPLVISEFFNLDRFGDVQACAVGSNNSAEEGRRRRLYQYTQLSKPNVTGYEQHTDLVRRSCIVIDDDNPNSNPNPVKFGGIYTIDDTLTNPVRGGRSITHLVGPLFFAFGQWRIIPRNEHDLILDDVDASSDTDNTTKMSTTITRDDDTTVRPSTSPNLIKRDDNSITVASANVLNYFTTLATGRASCYARGANNDVEFQRQQAKTTLALSQLNADIYGLLEVENFPGLASLDLARGLNGRNPTRNYVPASEGANLTTIGRDFIRVEILYDSHVLDLVGTATLMDKGVNRELLDESSDGIIFDGRNRVPLAATFRKKSNDVGGESGDDGGGGYITVIQSHFKSKGGGSSASGADVDRGDGAGAFNHVRKLAAQAILDWISEEPLFKITDNILIMGDLNSYAKEEPVQLLLDNGYNSVEDLVVDSTMDSETSPPYSYLFDGQYGTLDYILVKDGVEVLDAKIWHVNADEPDLLDYNVDFGRDVTIFDASVPFRFSDHDPLVASVQVQSGSSGNGDTSTLTSSSSAHNATSWIGRRFLKYFL